MLRDYLDAPRSEDPVLQPKLDMCLAGVAVDVKHTIGGNWTIPNEAVGHPCILIRENEQKGLCWCGLIVVRNELLNKGLNRDQKRGLSPEGMAKVRWLLRSHPYPRNFWLTLPEDVKSRIINHRGGTARIASLFREVQKVCIARRTIEGLGQQKDYMKRLRKNGGARDILLKEGIALLWGRNKNDRLLSPGISMCGDDEFMSVRAVTPEEARLLRVDYVPLKR